MTQESKLSLRRCISCGYDLAGLESAKICPECGAKTELLVDKSNYIKIIAIISMAVGVSSVLVAIGPIRLRSHYLWQVFGVFAGVVAIVFASKVRRAIRAGQAPSNYLGVALAGRVSGWIGLVVSLVIAAYLMFGIVLTYLLSLLGLSV